MLANNYLLPQQSPKQNYSDNGANYFGVNNLNAASATEIVFQ